MTDIITFESGTVLGKETHRLMHLHEVLTRFPKYKVNNLGDLVYDKERNRYIIPTMLIHLGTWHSGFHEELYVARADV